MHPARGLVRCRTGSCRGPYLLLAALLPLARSTVSPSRPHTTAQAPRCWCFDLCNDTTANIYWAASRGVHLHDGSPWLDYFAAVYSDAELPRPFPLHRFNYFYHGVRLWHALFPAVHNPFRPCDLPAPTERPGTPECTPSVCAAWRAPLSQPGRGDVTISSKVQVATGLMEGMTMQKRLVHGIPGFHGLPATRIVDTGQMERWRALGLPMADGGGDGGGWVEVHRTNVYDRGMVEAVIEEGKSWPEGLRQQRFDSSLKRWDNETQRRHELNSNCFFSAVVGSGVWVQVGSGYGFQGKVPAVWHTPHEPHTSGRARASKGKNWSYLGGAAQITTHLNLRGGTSLDVMLSAPPCAKRRVALGTCPPAQLLRTGWRAQRPCACTETWDFLNCAGGRAQSQSSPQTQRLNAKASQTPPHACRAANLRGQQRITHRFATGRPSSDLQAAGVVMRAFDETVKPTTAQQQPWATFTRRKGAEWHMSSASIVNHRLPYFFLGDVGHEQSPDLAWEGHAGFIIAPEAAQASLVCMYPKDGSSMQLRCYGRHDASGPDSCVPGCVKPKKRGWCPHGTSGIAPHRNCATAPTGLRHMMQLQEEYTMAFLNDSSHRDCARGCCVYPRCQLYNELVLNSTALLEHLPGAVEAVYFVDAGYASNERRQASGETMARTWHRSLIAHLQRSNATDPCRPLLKVGFGEGEPFRLVSPYRVSTL